MAGTDVMLTLNHTAMTAANNVTYNPSYTLTQYIETITISLVCLVGTVLNLLTAGAFLSRPLRGISCCLYLATRSLAVFGFLTSMFIAWTNTFMPLISNEGICELTVFLSYFCPFLSVWMVVIITVENFIRISQPSRVNQLCTPRVAKYVIVSFVLLGLAVNNFPLWTSRVIRGSCDVWPDFHEVHAVFNYLDAILTLVIPLALMIIVVPLVAVSAMHAYERKKRLSGDTGLRNRQCPEPKNSPEARVTHLLLAVSVVFLLLHTPFHGIRIKLFIVSRTEIQPASVDSMMLFVFRMVYNLDTVVSCAVYLVFGDNFRKVFVKLYFSRCSKQRSTTSGSEQATTLTENLMKDSVVSHTNGCGNETRLVSAADQGENDEEDEEARTRKRLLAADAV
ncbi:FMRFamide receptor-like [Physella acuta]|uniref:FMRFamide receptor-like n=1 Tax=Physella acuta TaxID=109671 RepID=UPI0027DD3820|nr:FMRFamide receptor-like [Physella acuta]